MIATRARLVRRRRGLAALAVAFVLAVAVVWAHSGMAMDHMGTPAAVCLAVIDGAVFLGAAVLGPRLVAFARAVEVPPDRPRGSVFVPPPTSAPARAGPARLQVFRL